MYRGKKSDELHCATNGSEMVKSNKRYVYLKPSHAAATSVTLHSIVIRHTHFSMEMDSHQRYSLHHSHVSKPQQKC